jgi:type I restriction enzyme S subunit
MPERKKGVVPLLRFPEFRDAEEWKVKRLGKVYRFIPTNSLSRDKLNYAHGRVKNIHYGDIHTKFRPLFDINNEDVPYVNDGTSPEQFDQDAFCMNGDVIFADASEDVDDIGKAIEIVNTDGQKLVAGLHTLHARPIGLEFSPGFSGYSFQTRGIRKQIQRESQGAKVLGISVKRLATISIYVPGKKEQQKIADCLSSLDKVIELEAQKLEALKTHKKGLMQQLFPREGETTPRLRFPEFRDAEEWEVKRLGEICSTFSGGTPSSSRKEYYGGSIPFIRSAEINQDTTELFLTEEGLENSSAKQVVKGDILIALYGANSGDGALSKIDGAINQAILCLRSKFNHMFILDYWRLRKNEIVTQYIQGGQGNLSAEIVKSIAFAFPTLPEQQKIADFFSSLDEIIDLQALKVKALKTHKKGLMQQLFPQEVD